MQDPTKEALVEKFNNNLAEIDALKKSNLRCENTIVGNDQKMQKLEADNAKIKLDHKTIEADVEAVRNPKEVE